MKVLIMAAGVGSRISRHLQGQPKCCVDIGGKPLITRTFETLYKRGLSDIAIVTGYSKEFVYEALKGYKYKSYVNPFFRVTNSIASAWFALDFMDEDDDLIILNGDLFFEEELLDIVIEEINSPVMLSDSSRIEDADYRFSWENNLLKRFGKELTNEETTGEYVGIGKLRSHEIKKFKDDIEYLIDSGEYNCWWEDALYRGIEEGYRVFIRDIKGVFWAEVDYIEDYERIIEYIK